jgi:NarL family two-component system response regulator LiaR
VTIGPNKDDDRRKTRFNILLIEDSDTDALLIQSHMEKLVDFSLQTVQTLSQALECLDVQNFDVILLDLNLPDALGLEGLVKLRRHVQRMPIVVLTGVADKELGIMALQRGAQDYLIKGVDNSRLVESIRYAIERVLVHDPDSSIVSQHSNFISNMEGDRKAKSHEILTERELQVLKLLGTGCSNQEIADRLGISLTTVKTHMGSIMQKLSVSDRTNALIEAQHKGLI